MEIDLGNHQYPIGTFIVQEEIPDTLIRSSIDEIENLPMKLRAEVSGLDDLQLQTPYREGGWTVAQVVHHIPDSHMNSYIRFKLALTEDRPSIRPYYEDRWARLPEAVTSSIEMSLDLLAALHIRWVSFLRELRNEDLELIFVHPESGSEISLAENICHYAWHGNHHLAQIQSLKIRMGWN